MPVGDPKPQTRATKKYEIKAGIISKSYKLKREVVEAFAEACKEAGVSQASKLSEMMIGYCCKKEVELEFKTKKDHFFLVLGEIDTAISQLKKNQTEMACESVKEELGENIEALEKLKGQLRQDVLDL